MKYIVGNIGDIRDDFNYLPVKFLNDLTKDHLIKAKKYKDYQIIDVENQRYYDPNKNEWIKIS